MGNLYKKEGKKSVVDLPKHGKLGSKFLFINQNLGMPSSTPPLLTPEGNLRSQD
jgi:hypothetical protein